MLAINIRAQRLKVHEQDGYFMPFYFQAVQGTSPTTSGIRFISLALPVTLMIGLSGALTTRTGNYVSKFLQYHYI